MPRTEADEYIDKKAHRTRPTSEALAAAARNVEHVFDRVLERACPDCGLIWGCACDPSDLTG